MLNWRFIVSIVIEFGPLLTFFIGNEIHGFFFGTVVLLIAVPFSLVAGFIRDRRFAIFPFCIGMFVLLLGGATVVTHNPTWLKVEFTLYNSIFGFALLIGFANGVPLLKRLFNDIFAITDRGWMTLSLQWGIFLVFIAVANELIRRIYPTHIWVDFRGISAILSLLFAATQARITHKERLPEATLWGLKK